MFVSDGRVVEDLHDVHHDLVDGGFGVLPGVDDAWSGVLQDFGGDLAGWGVQDVAEVVF